MKRTINHRDYEFQWITVEELDPLMKFMEQVYETIENKETFKLDTKETIANMLYQGAKALGVYYQGELAAIRYTVIPNKEDNLAYDVDLFEIDPRRVAINDTVMVKERHRGYKLQNITRELIVEALEKEGFEHFMSTISPNNIASYRNTVKSGYQIVALKKKYPDEKNPLGYDRFILHHSNYLNYEYTGNQRWIDHGDLEEIRKAIAKKYIGTDVRDDGSILFKEVKIKHI
ncbi:MAG: GNAT family N-acetyltransferase [Tissierellia bacterium]|nr:GNAT family N-acetyltransferase [Tissierellia bacterium]